MSPDLVGMLENNESRQSSSTLPDTAEEHQRSISTILSSYDSGDASMARHINPRFDQYFGGQSIELAIPHP
jgi:hypothetical protein